eukprot:TRINITY_DN834_c0_g1_i1.p1 TRINITY_DN834_c0_g1~~TRINITY_DN834_c0_g1_i1.p1  ORF type:complete len:384 (+),score=37.22 TRINITY_DN834_c0_g1_i1:106-1152(+)
MRQGLVTVRRPLLHAAFNTLMTMLLGWRFEYSLPGLPNVEGDQFHAFVKEYFEVCGAFNWSDFVPFVRYFDPHGIIARCRIINSFQSAYIEKEIEEHKRRMTLSADFSTEGNEDVPRELCDVVLKGEGPEHLEGLTLTTLLQTLLMSGAKPSTTVEWALLELLRKPDAMNLLRDELDKSLGPPKQDVAQAAAHVIVEEKMEKLPYLNAVIKETLRMHPPFPLFLPHATSHEPVALLGGRYHVPPFTTIRINAWALAHDSNVWKEPFAFRPERFLNGESEGREFHFMPFGTGGRECPIRPLGGVLVRLMLGVLVHTFEWQCSGIPDNSDRVGLTTGPFHALEPSAFPRY